MPQVIHRIALGPCSNATDWTPEIKAPLTNQSYWFAESVCSAYQEREEWCTDWEMHQIKYDCPKHCSVNEIHEDAKRSMIAKQEEGSGILLFDLISTFYSTLIPLRQIFPFWKFF